MAARSKAWVFGRSLAELRVRFPPKAQMYASCESYHVEVSASGPISRPEESYRLWSSLCVIVKPRQWEGPGPLAGCRAMG